MTRLEQRASLRTSDTREFEAAVRAHPPDLVFNCSHIHGIAGELPLKVAHRMGIPTAGFIFSWDNLTSRSRIFVPYDHWLVWHEGMKRQLLEIYPEIPPERVHVTGTPQFDYHFKPEYDLGRRGALPPHRHRPRAALRAVHGRDRPPLLRRAPPRRVGDRPPEGDGPRAATAARRPLQHQGHQPGDGGPRRARHRRRGLPARLVGPEVADAHGRTTSRSTAACCATAPSASTPPRPSASSC